MKKSRLWLPIFMAVSIILWVITLILTPGDPIAIYGDPEVFNAHLPILSYGATRILCPVIGVAMVLLFGAHAWITMGKKPAVSMIGLALFIAFFFEEIGIRTGWVFGPYFHCSIEGPKLDTVPLFVVCVWVACIYIGWSLSNLILDGTPTQTDFKTSRLFLGALLGAMITTTMDLGADPFCVSNGWWVWYRGGVYAGVPLHNYVGWMALGMLTILVHGFDFRQQQMTPLNTLAKWKKIATVLPLCSYGVLWVAFTLLNPEGFVGLVVFFAMGIPFVIACTKWVRWYKAAAA